MRKCDLSTDQLLHLNIFNLILEFAGWDDLHDTEKRFDAGQMVTPEGNRCLESEGNRLEARFHAPINMITLRVTDTRRNRVAVMHFLFDKSPERILEWIRDQGPTLAVDNYERLLASAEGRCELTLIETPEAESFEVRPSSPEAGYGFV